MSKLSLIERNKKRIKLYKKYKAKHDTLLKQANNKKLSPEEQFQARLKWLNQCVMFIFFDTEFHILELFLLGLETYKWKFTHIT